MTKYPCYIKTVESREIYDKIVSELQRWSDNFVCGVHKFAKIEVEKGKTVDDQFDLTFRIKVDTNAALEFCRTDKARDAHDAYRELISGCLDDIERLPDNYIRRAN